MFAGILSWATGALASIWTKVLIVGGIVAAVGFVLLGAKNAGRNAEKVEQVRINEKVRKQSEQVRKEVRDLSPTDRERVRERYYRD